MQVLLITGGFAGPGRQPWLLDDLATALVRAGHTVDVIVGDTKSSRPRGEQPAEDPRITIFSVGATSSPRGRLARLHTRLRVGIGLHTSAYAWATSRRYDLCIFTSPASFSWGLPRRLRRAGITRRTLLFLWDFFPIHQLEIGRINQPAIARVMKFVERWAIDGADVVALMSPANTRFFTKYHQGATNVTVEIPPWSSGVLDEPFRNSGDNTRESHSTFTVLFGGQITKGRGVDTLVEAASLLEETDANIRILVAGDGPELPSLVARAAELRVQNLEFLGAMPREAYRNLARTATVGVAITVAGVSPPSFPSKIVEYCSLGVPVIVCVEEASDAGEFIERNAAGISVPVGDPAALASAIESLAGDRESGRIEAMGAAARDTFERQLNVDRVVETLAQLVTRDA